VKIGLSAHAFFIDEMPSGKAVQAIFRGHRVRFIPREKVGETEA
jgi:hypothetical protein